MQFSPYHISTPLEERKLILEHVINDMQEYYNLSREELCQYIIPTSLTPEDLQIDLLIHALALYQTPMDLSIIQTVINSYPDVYAAYKQGNDKSLNVLVGKTLQINKSLSPKDIIDAFKKQKELDSLLLS